MDLQVIGVGFGRTGTTSTKAALEDLGFGPCYTFATTFQRPRDVDVWLDAYTRRPIDWTQFLGDFQSTIDWPACDFYDQLMTLYPEAKVLLNVRDPESWYESMKNTIWAVHQAGVKAGQGSDMDHMSRLREIMLWQGTFGGRFEDRRHAIAIFEQHTQQIMDRVPHEKLLVFDVKEGWEPLCRFLGVAIPQKPFPRLNDTEAFRDLVKRMQPQLMAAR